MYFHQLHQYKYTILIFVLILAPATGCVQQIKTTQTNPQPTTISNTAKFEKSIDKIIEEASNWHKLASKQKFNQAKGNMAIAETNLEKAKAALENMDKNVTSKQKQLKIADELITTEKWALHTWRTGKKPDLSKHKSLLRELKMLRNNQSS